MKRVHLSLAIARVAGLTACFATPAFAAPVCGDEHTVPQTYYVATRDGNVTGDGDINNPFRELSKALDCAVPAAGDTIVILGAYPLAGTQTIGKSNLTLRGQTRVFKDGQPPAPSYVSCPSNLLESSCFRLSGGTNVAITDMTIEGGARAPIDIGATSSSIRIERNKLRNHADAPGDQRFGIHVYAGQNNPNVGILIRDNDISSYNTGVYAHGAAYLTVERNQVHDIRHGDGIVGVRLKASRIVSNTVERLPMRPAGVNCPTSGLATGIKLRESTDVSIKQNTVRDVTGAGIMVRRVDPADGRSPDMPPSTLIKVIGNTVNDVVTAYLPSNQPGDCDSNWPGAMVLSYVDDLTVTGNTVRRNHGEGVTINSSTKVLVEANDFRDNFGANIYLNNTSGAQVLRNFTSYTDGETRFLRFGLPAIGISLANEAQSHPTEAKNFRPLSDITIAHNIVRSGRAGINHFWDDDNAQAYHLSGLQNVRIYNNTVHGQLDAPLIVVTPLGAGRVTPPHIVHSDIHVNSNIFVQRRPFAMRKLLLPTSMSAAPIRYAGNTWYRPLACNNCDVPAAIPEDYAYDPLFAVPPGMEVVSYKITAGSSARDAAVYTFADWEAPALDFFGTQRPTKRRDVGAHEVAP